MKEKKKSAVSWILTWAGQKRIAYVWSVLLAIGNVIFKILPYFIIADVVKLFLNGEKEFEIYLAKAVLIALSFIIAELLHSLSTALSHKATFALRPEGLHWKVRQVIFFMMNLFRKLILESKQEGFYGEFCNYHCETVWKWRTYRR